MTIDCPPGHSARPPSCSDRAWNRASVSPVTDLSPPPPPSSRNRRAPFEQGKRRSLTSLPLSRTTAGPPLFKRERSLARDNRKTEKRMPTSASVKNEVGTRLKGTSRSIRYRQGTSSTGTTRDCSGGLSGTGQRAEEDEVRKPTEARGEARPNSRCHTSSSRSLPSSQRASFAGPSSSNEAEGSQSENSLSLRIAQSPVSLKRRYLSREASTDGSRSSSSSGSTVKLRVITAPKRRSAYGPNMSIHDKIDFLIRSGVCTPTLVNATEEVHTLSICGQFAGENHEAMIRDADRVRQYQRVSQTAPLRTFSSRLLSLSRGLEDDASLK